MRRIVLFFGSALTVCSLYALELTVTSGESDDLPYSVLSIEHGTPFSCKALSPRSFSCFIPGAALSRKEPVTTRDFTALPTATGKGVLLSVTTAVDAHLFATDKNILGDTPLSPLRPASAQRWQMIAHAGTLPFITPRRVGPSALAFPVAMPPMETPSVGPLDISGQPLPERNDFKDIRAFFEAKKALDAHDYPKVIALVDKELAKNPKTLFAGEYGFMKMRALARTPSPDNARTLAAAGPVWLKEHPIDENAPEVLVMLGDAHAMLSDQQEADYYYQRTASDFPDSRFAQIAMIHQADLITATKKIPKALELYNRALHETKDLATASLAASKMAQRFITLKQPENAVMHYQKIFEGNPDFFLADPDGTLKTIDYLQRNGARPTARDLAAFLYKKTDPKNERYPTILLTLDELLEKSGDRANAKKGYERYLSLFPNAEHAADVKKKLTKMMLDAAPGADPLPRYDRVIADDKGGELAQTALYKKASYLFESGHYGDVLALAKPLMALPAAVAPDKAKLVAQSAMKRAITDLDGQQCDEAVALVKSYKLAIPRSHELPLFTCLVQTGDTETAKKISGSYLAKADPIQKLTWMERHLQLLKKERNDAAVFALAGDIVTYAESVKPAVSFDPYRAAYDRFFAARRLGNDPAATVTAGLIEQHYPMDTANLDVYKELTTMALKRGDMLSAERNAEKLLATQHRFNVATYTPWADFIAADARASRGDHAGAVRTLEAAMAHKLTRADQAHALYALAQNRQRLKMSPQAKNDLQRCTALKGNGSWDKLCRDALELFK